MLTRRLMIDTGRAAGVDYLATKAMERFNMVTYMLEVEADRERDERV